MPANNRLTRRLGLTHPIIQAPLAGGGDTPDLVAAVCNAGALGFIGAAYLTPPQIIDTSRAVRERTGRPFGINLFVPLPCLMRRRIRGSPWNMLRRSTQNSDCQLRSSRLRRDIPSANNSRPRSLMAHEDETRLTRAFSGRPARGIVNRFMSEIDRAPEHILPFPLQNTLTRPLRTAAAKLGRAEFLSLWAGQGVRLARRQSAGSLVARLANETEEAVVRLCDAAR